MEKQHMSLTRAMSIVHELALENALDESRIQNTTTLAEKAKEQNEALDVVKTFIDNSKDEESE